MISFVKLALRARFALGPLRSFALVCETRAPFALVLRRVIRVVLERNFGPPALRCEPAVVHSGQRAGFEYVYSTLFNTTKTIRVALTLLDLVEQKFVLRHFAGIVLEIVDTLFLS